MHGPINNAWIPVIFLYRKVLFTLPTVLWKTTFERTLKSWAEVISATPGSVRLNAADFGEMKECSPSGSPLSH